MTRPLCKLLRGLDNERGRLAPDCSKVELADLQKEQEVERLLHAMGWETANVHLGSATAAALLVDLASRHESWLQQPVEEMLAAVQSDWSDWKKAPEVKSRDTASVALAEPRAARKSTKEKIPGS